MKLKKVCLSLVWYTLVIASVGSAEPYGNIVVNIKAVYELDKRPTDCQKWKNGFDELIEQLEMETTWTTQKYLCVQKVNLYVPSFWDLNCAPGISMATVKEDPEVLIAPTVDFIPHLVDFRTPSYCNTSSKAVICPFSEIEASSANILMRALFNVKYLPLTYTDSSNKEREIDCSHRYTFKIEEFVRQDIAKRKRKKELGEPISDCTTKIEYFYYEDDSEKVSIAPEVKVTSDGVDAALSVTYGGKELDGVSVMLKVQGAEVKNVEMKNSGDVYRAQVTGLAPGKYDLVFVITGQEAKVKGDFQKVKCCESFLYGSDGVGYFGNFERTVKSSVQVSPSDRPGPQPGPLPGPGDPASGKGDDFTNENQNVDNMVNTDSPPENDKSQDCNIIIICLIVAGCLAGLVVLGVLVKLWMDNNKSKKKKRKSKEDLEEDEYSADNYNNSEDDNNNNEDDDNDNNAEDV